jgi:hypothetical protein
MHDRSTSRLGRGLMACGAGAGRARRTHSRRGHRAVAMRAAVGWRGWPACSGGQGVPGKAV